MVCSVVRCIWTFLKVPIPFVLTAVPAFYMSSSLYYNVTMRETVLGLLRGILEKKIKLKKFAGKLVKSWSIYGLLYGQSKLRTRQSDDS